MTFDEFVAKEHRRRVAHLVRFAKVEKVRPTLADAVEIFGFVEKDAKPILEDAIAELFGELVETGKSIKL